MTDGIIKDSEREEVLDVRDAFRRIAKAMGVSAEVATWPKLAALIEDWTSGLQDPVRVHVSILRGEIKLRREDALHIGGTSEIELENLRKAAGL